MKDLDCHAMLAESSWETMQREARASEEAGTSELCRALEEYLAAEFQEFLWPGTDSDVRLLCATTALRRAERRMGR